MHLLLELFANDVVIVYKFGYWSLNLFLLLFGLRIFSRLLGHSWLWFFSSKLGFGLLVLLLLESDILLDNVL